MTRFAVIAAAGTLVAALVGAATAAGGTTATHVAQVGYPLQIVVRGDRVLVGYEARNADGTDIPSTSGTLFVRNDRQVTFTAVRLVAVTAEAHRRLQSVIPPAVIGGHKLLYYATVDAPSLPGPVTLPAGGSRSPEFAYVVNNAFRVHLGTHRFRRTLAPGAVVARARKGEVGFNDCPDAPGSCGQPMGPVSFDVTPGRAVWMFDFMGLDSERKAGKLLGWAPGNPRPIARTIQLPFRPQGWQRGTEFAQGPRGSFYAIRGPLPGDKPGVGQRLTRISRSGQVLWTSRLPGCCGFSTRLWTGPNGTVYWSDGTEEARDMSGWSPRFVPVATADGRAIAPTVQNVRTRWTEPLPGGLGLVRSHAAVRNDGPHEVRLARIGNRGQVVRSWRITSSTPIYSDGNQIPGFVGGDPVLVLTAATARNVEYVVVRLGPRGGVRVRFSLPKRAYPQSAFGSFAIDDIRIKSDGRLYQLGSEPSYGAAVYRYSVAYPRR